MAFIVHQRCWVGSVGCLLNIQKCIWLGGKVRVKKMVNKEWKMDWLEKWKEVKKERKLIFYPAQHF